MPRTTMHGLKVPTHGEALRALDAKIASLGVELAGRLEAGEGFAEINVTIGFMKRLMLRRDSVLMELRKESRKLKIHPGKLYEMGSVEDVDRGLEIEK